jgi:thiol-disulfide isomerase/thioredoxin
MVLFFLLLMPTFFQQVKGQSRFGIQELSVGDTVPDIEFQMINYHLPSAKLSDFKQDLIILDFWATWCSACVSGFPKLDSLQNRFKKDLKVLLVNSTQNRDKREGITRFFKEKKNVNGKDYTLPSVINDTMAALLFKHRSVPHCVLIYRRRVIGITYPEYVTADNIYKILNGEPVNFRLKKEYNLSGQPKTYDLDTADAKLLCSSRLTRYSKRSSGAGFEGALEKTTKIYANNTSLRHLFTMAYGLPPVSVFPINRYIILAKDSVKFYELRTKESVINNSFCYELKSYPIGRDSLRLIMQKDLTRLFNFRGGIKKQVVKCYILKTNGYIKNAFTKGGLVGMNVNYHSRAKGQYVTNFPLDELVSGLNSISRMPILNETGLKANLDLILPDNLSDIESLKKIFRNQGIDVLDAERELEMFVISEVDQ